MKTASTLLLSALLSACAVFAPENLGPDAARRDGLWRQGHAAMQRDSFRIAMAAFQRLAAEHPRTDQGRDARFYLGTLYLEPSNPAYDAILATQNLEQYLALDTSGGRITRRPEAETLLGLSRQLAVPCEQRTGSLRCDPTLVTRSDTTVVVRPGAYATVRLTTPTRRASPSTRRGTARRRSAGSASRSTSSGSPST